MNSACSRRASNASRKFKAAVSQGDIPKSGTQSVRSIMDLIEVHDRGIVSTSKAVGFSPAIVFEVFRQEMSRRVGEAYGRGYSTGFRDGRFTPVRHLGSSR